MTRYNLTALDNVFTIYVGGDMPTHEHFSAKKCKDFPFPIISNGTGREAIRGYTDIPKISPPTISISARGTIGYVAYHNIAIYPTVRLLCLRIKHDDDPTFMYYAAKSLRYPMSTTVIPQLTAPMLKQIKLPKPSIDEQQQIARILSTIDKIIAHDKIIVEKLAKAMRLIYSYWFVQFDFPDENGRPYKSSGGKMVYNEQLKQEIPEGWKVSNLLDTSIATLIKPGIDKFHGTKTYLATGDVIGTSIKDNSAKITFDNRETRANMQPVANSIWFAKMKDSIKHIVVTDKSDDLINDHIFSTGFCGFRASENCLGFLAAYISQPQFEIIKDSLAHGATQKAVSNSDLSNIKTIEPPTDILCKFEHIVKPMLYLMNSCRQESKLLASLRDWLLPMLMNGQVRIDASKEQNNEN